MPAASSPTQRRLTADALTALLRERFGRTATACAPLSGGTFAAVWRATLEDGTDVAVKVAPPPAAGLLRYERGLVAAEAGYYRTVARRAPGVPVPEVLHADDEVLVVRLLPGRPLTEAPEADDDTVRCQLGTALHELHSVTGTRFGYEGSGRACGATWREAYTAITEDLLADAEDWGVPLPVRPATLRDAVARHADALDDVRTPALIHFDLWDGNVLCAGGRLTGLVDGERHLWGDPIYDFVSPALGRRMEELPEHPVLRGYFGAPHTFSTTQRRRIMLCRLQLTLLMLVEMPSRAVTGAAATERYDWLAPQLLADLADLG